ncbi:MAG: M28 family peptidase [Holophaga sp.]|nr:M28 family peptidase [Holophaga sp.]
MKKHLLSILALSIGIILGLLSMVLPAPAKFDAPGFSAERARQDIDIIARAPHSVWDQGSLQPVRDHIRSRLMSLGLAPATMRYPEVTDRSGHRYPLENISASIPGRSGSFVLLVAHYDSAPRKKISEASYGAADDGYGVATMLEIAGLLVRNKIPLENGVRFLFTDAEETGLLGAAAEMDHNLAAYRDVNLVINLEARGVKGPVVMFETGKHNLATIRLFQKARRPFSYSFSVDVYRKMPNGTDFSEFTKKGFAGLNFAVLDDLSFYHTQRDSLENISLTSLQHYGEQVFPMVLAYTADARFAGVQAFASTENMVYFTWLPGLFFAWPATWDRVFCGILGLVFFLWAGGMIAKKRARLGASLLWLLGWFAMAAMALGAGLGTSWLASRITNIPWRLTYMPNVPGERFWLWALMLMLALGSFGLAARSSQKTARDRSPLLGALGLNLLLTVGTLFLLPGGTFLFSIPLLVALVAVFLADWGKRPRIALVAVVFIVSIFIPVLHVIFLALTLGALGLVLWLAAIPLALMATLAAEASNR